MDRTELVATKFHKIPSWRRRLWSVASTNLLEKETTAGWLDVPGVRRYYRAGNSICASCSSTMERVDRLCRGFFSNQLSRFGWRISLTLFCLAFAILVVALLAARIHSIDLSSLLLGVALATLCVVLLLLFRFLHLANEQHQQADSALDTTETSLLESEVRFRQMAVTSRKSSG